MSYAFNRPTTKFKGISKDKGAGMADINNHCHVLRCKNENTS